MPVLAEGSEARLAWYFDLAHGSGLAYRVVTVTAVEDGTAWARLAERVARGDLQSWARDLDGLRHGTHSRTSPPCRGRPPSLRSTEIPPGMAPANPACTWRTPCGRSPASSAGTSRRQEWCTARPSGPRVPGCRWSVALGLEMLPGAGRSPEVTLLQRLSSLPPLIAPADRGHPTRGDRRRDRGCTRPSSSGTGGGRGCCARHRGRRSRDAAGEVAGRCCSCTRPTG